MGKVKLYHNGMEREYSDVRVTVSRERWDREPWYYVECRRTELHREIWDTVDAGKDVNEMLDVAEEIRERMEDGRSGVQRAG